MAVSRASIRVALDRPVLRGWPITVRVQTPDLAVVAEGIPGFHVQIPATGTFFASAVDANGLQVAGAVRIEAAGEASLPDLSLPVLAGTEPARKMLLEEASAAGAAADDTPGLSPPPFQYAYVLRYAESIPLEPLDADLFIQIMRPMDLEQPPTPSNVAAYGLVFAGPRGPRLSVVPWNLHEPPAGTIVWRPSKTPGHVLPSFMFHDAAANAACATLGRAGAAMPLHDPRTSGLASVLRALGSLRDLSQWEQIEDESLSWSNSWPAIPDAQAVRAEVLARMGKHSEARKVLESMSPYSLPWTRTGLVCLTERFDFYDREPDRWKTPLHGRQWYRNLLGKCHPASTFCLFELSPKRPAA